MSMEWASDNIAAFGGDPDKVTLWGHASGGVSAFDQLVFRGGKGTYNDRKLFRGAIMSSGSFLPAAPLDSKKCNDIFTTIVMKIGCFYEKDRLQCVREKPYSDFVRATSTLIPGALSAEALRLLYVPRPDNDLLLGSQEDSLKDNMFVSVPMIFGTQEDEGTIFIQKQTSVNSTRRLMNYLERHYFHNISDGPMESFVKQYHTKPSHGSPYGTGDNFENWKGQKRLSSIIGDVFFTIPQRIAMSLISSSQRKPPTWAYRSAYDHGNDNGSALGTAHGSFEAMVFETDEYMSSFITHTTRMYLLNFLYDLDPNSREHVDLAAWPKWTAEEPQVLQLNKSIHTPLKEKEERGYKFMKRNLERFRI
jgi:carboxylesterase type B